MKNNRHLISVVVPCFNEGGNIPFVINSLKEALKDHRCEVILVDDGSADNSRSLCREACQQNGNIYYIRFSRNFGHQAALLAGIHHAQGDAIITIDADLQQPPSLIPEMIERWKQGAEIVEGVPVHVDSVGWFKKYTSYLFYKVLSTLTDCNVVRSVNDFRLIDRKVANVLRSLPETELYLRGLFSWMGFKHEYIKYRHLKRVNGDTHYPLRKQFRLALNGITSMSTKPLRLALVLGLIVSAIAFVIILWALYIAMFTDKAIHGWTSTIVSSVFLAGIQLLVVGIMGEYLGKLFTENKRRPAYIIAETHLEKEESNSFSFNESYILNSYRTKY